MRSLSGKESYTTGMSLLCKCSVYASGCAKSSTFVQEYAMISSRKSDKDCRKAVIDLRCLTRSTRSTTRQQIEEAFTPDEIQQALSQLKAGRAAGPDGIDPNIFRHLSINRSLVVLSIISSSWHPSWCLLSWCSANVVPFLKCGKDPAEVGSHSPTALIRRQGRL